MLRHFLQSEVFRTTENDDFEDQKYHRKSTGYKVSLYLVIEILLCYFKKLSFDLWSNV